MGIGPQPMASFYSIQIASVVQCLRILIFCRRRRKGNFKDLDSQKGFLELGNREKYDTRAVSHTCNVFDTFLSLMKLLSPTFLLDLAGFRELSELTDRLEILCYNLY